MKYTPGPWSAWKKVVTEDGSSQLIRAKGCVVAEVLGQSLGIGEANARLIEASPDLLAILKGIQDLFHGRAGDETFATAYATRYADAISELIKRIESKQQAA